MSTTACTTGIDQLLEGGRNLALPFVVALRDAPSLNVSTALRLLPGKRLSARAQWGDVTVMAKLFVTSRHGARYAQAEAEGCQLLQRARIDTPRQLWRGESVCGRLQVVLFEFLQPSCSLLETLSAQNPQDRKNIIDVLLGVTAALHRVGAQQTDPHLDNFLWHRHQVWLVDAGSVESRTPLAANERLRNLALLLAQLPLAWHDDVTRWCERYNALMPEFDRLTTAALKSQVEQAWRARGENVIRKALRECTATHVEHSWRRFLACRRDRWNNELQTLLADPDVAMRHGTMLKDGNSATVVLVTCGGHQFVVKRYNVKSVWHFLRRSFRNTRAWQSWCNAHLLEFAGINTAAPVALLEKRIGPLRYIAYFVAEFKPASEMLDVYAAREPELSELLQTREIFVLMRRAKLSHGDLKAQNLLIGADGVVRLIDLDAMRWHADDASWQRDFDRDMQRFLRNWRGDLRNGFAAIINGGPPSVQ
jgi:hypothetical protein